MTATLVQTASNLTSTGAASLAVGSGQGWAAPTAGNLLIAWANSDTTMTLSGWTAGPSVVDQNAAYLWYKVAAGTETSVTFSAGGSTSPFTVGLMEYSGATATPFDVQGTSSIQVTAGTTTTAVSVTGTGTNGDLLIAVAALHFLTATAPTGPTWTNSFVNRMTVGPTTNASAAINDITFVGDFQNTAAATVSTACSWTNNASNRQELLIAFKLAAAGTTAVFPVSSQRQRRQNVIPPRKWLARQGRVFVPLPAPTAAQAPTFVAGRPRRRDLPRAVLLPRRQTLDLTPPDQPGMPAASPRRRPGRRFTPVPLIESGTASLTGMALVPPRPRQAPRRPRFMPSRVNSATTGPVGSQVAPVPPLWVPAPARRLRALLPLRRRGNVDVVVAAAPLVTPAVWVPRPVRQVLRGVLPGRRRGNAAEVPPAVPDVPAEQPARRRVQRPLIRGRVAVPVQTQTAPAAPAWPTPPVRALRRFLAPARRGRTATPTPAQQAAPVNPPLPLAEVRGLRRFLTPTRRPRVAAPIPGQLAAPVAPPITQTTTGRVRRMALTRRRPAPAVVVHGAHNPAPANASSPRRTPPARRRPIDTGPPLTLAAPIPARVPQPARRALRHVLAAVRRGTVVVGRLVGAAAPTYVRPGNLGPANRPAPNLTVEQVNRTGITTVDRPTPGITKGG